MANDIDEQLSALIDGELTEKELDVLLARLRSESPLRHRLGRYSLISDAMHKNLPPHVDHDLSARVSQALAREPAIVAAPRRRPRHFAPWAKQAAGIAIAASVTAVAILGFQMLHAPTTAPVTVAAETPVTTDKELEPYLANHNEQAVSSGMHGMLPYVRLVGHGESE